MLSLIIWGTVAVAGLYFVLKYNQFVTLRNRAKNAEAQIDVQLKKRADLVPNLVETVKGYAKHEKEIFEKVAELRSRVSGGTMKERMKANSELSSALKSLIAVAENYPELKASENFKLLQEQLAGIESKIAYARQFYNDAVMKYNTELQKFPGNLIASLFRMKEMELFDVPEEEKAVPKVEF